MKLPQSIIVSAAIGLMVGIIAPRPDGDSGASSQKPSAPRTRVNRAMDRTVAGNPPTSPGQHTLRALLHLNLSRVYRDEVFIALEQAGDEALEKLLRDLIALDTPGESARNWNLKNRVVREIYQRKGRQSVEWAEQLGQPDVFGMFIGEVARENAISAAEWIPRFKNLSRRHLEERIQANPGLLGGSQEIPEYDQNEFSRLASDVSDMGLWQGADTALELRNRMGADFDDFAGSQSLPDDFDCGKYLGALPVESIRASLSSAWMIGFWASRDRDAAFEFARNLPDPPAGQMDWKYESLFVNVCRLDGEEVAASWLAGRLAQASDEERRRVLSRLYVLNPPSPTAFRDILAGLDHENDRFAFASSVILSIRRGGNPSPYLDLLGSGSLRERVLGLRNEGQGPPGN